MTGRIMAAAMASALVARNSRLHLDEYEGKAAVKLDPTIPDRVCVERSSRYYVGGIGRMLGVLIDGKEYKDVIEYSVSGGWARIRGQTEAVYGTIAPYWHTPPSRQVRRQLARMS